MSKKSVTLILLTFILIIFAGYSMYLSHQVKQLSEDVQQYQQSIYALDLQNTQLSNKVIELKSRQTEVVSQKKEEPKNQLAIDIANNTPLNYETAEIVIKYSQKFDLKPSLILSVMELESKFKQYEVGADDDRGYMQIIPGTEKWLAQEFKDELGFDYNPDRIFEPEYNIGLASAYLSLLQSAYGNNYDRILSEYNRGPYNLAEYYERNQTYETSYSRVILKKEQKYLVYNK